jgi:hypothetical protein
VVNISKMPLFSIPCYWRCKWLQMG